jgi:mono/diheme cytochrome c family protein
MTARHIYLLLPVLFALIIACGEGEKPAQAGSTVDPLVAGGAIFTQYCTICHGVDGKLGVNGAKDITGSALTKEERITLITNGKKTMTAFGGILNPDEIEAAALYSMSLGK